MGEKHKERTPVWEAYNILYYSINVYVRWCKFTSFFAHEIRRRRALISFLPGYQVSIVMVIDIVNGHRIPGHSRWLLSRLTASYDDDDDDDDRGGGEDPTLIRRNDLYRSRGLFESNRPNNCRVCIKKWI